MAQIPISELSKTLLSSKARWVAAENHISIMDSEARKKLLGFDTETAPKAKAFAAGAAPVAGAFDPLVDWRNRNGNHITAVKDQGGCGSCVSFCTVAVTEAMASIELNQLLDLSEADQHFCSSHGATCNGWNHSAAFDQIKTRGVCDEACFPYASAFPNNNIWFYPHLPPPPPPFPLCNPCANRNAMAVKITALHNLDTYQQAKEYLTHTGPIATGFIY
jgi:hypothetical protein